MPVSFMAKERFHFKELQATGALRNLRNICSSVNGRETVSGLLNANRLTKDRQKMFN